jgi:hypothetical protein
MEGEEGGNMEWKEGEKVGGGGDSNLKCIEPPGGVGGLYLDIVSVTCRKYVFSARTTTSRLREGPAR